MDDNKTRVTTIFKGEPRRKVLEVGDYEVLVTRTDNFRCTNIEAATVLKIATESLLKKPESPI